MAITFVYFFFIRKLVFYCYEGILLKCIPDIVRVIAALFQQLLLQLLILFFGRYHHRKHDSIAEYEQRYKRYLKPVGCFHFVHSTNISCIPTLKQIFGVTLAFQGIYNYVSPLIINGLRFLQPIEKRRKLKKKIVGDDKKDQSLLIRSSISPSLSSPSFLRRRNL